MGYNRAPPVIDEVVGRVDDRFWGDVSQTINPVVPPNVFNLGGADIPVRVVGVPSRDVSVDKDAGILARREPMTGR